MTNPANRVNRANPAAPDGYDPPLRIAQWGLFGGRGGIESFIMDCYRHIDRSRVQFDFLESHAEGPLPYEDEIRELGGRVFRVMYSERESFRRSRTELLRFYRAHPEIAGVHVHANFPYALPLLMAKRSGIALRVLHSHNSGAADGHVQAEAPKRLERFLRSAVVNRQIDQTPTHYFACSDIAAEYMFPGKPFRWVKNGIDTRRFAFDGPTRAAVRSALRIGNDTTVIGFCGRFRPQKNPLFLLRIFARYMRLRPDSLLLLVGDGELRSRMERDAADLGIGGHVRFLGERADVQDLYQAMDAFVLPSLYEGLPIVCIEAQCAGLPCLTSREAVTEQARLTDLMAYRSLDDDPEIWAGTLHDLVDAGRDRRRYAGLIRATGFDMNDVAAELQRFYIAHAGRQI
ncbi:glycosyltransferase [Bifidobacterium catulorum]|uniref:Glycosyltransferase family 1 protein n=1 Tax=Bifidobacterium catulorum TaxID=1630173 RepID=A0A2U2MT10_9BIFI|nr:glycosyltransferase [Bifidobacterium catulorum]PWG59989.1 glycosyltransferase family 1 protein [Bifidobacterium catulorum]